MNAPEPPVRPGDILAGKYRVERVLGVGGMGMVVAATHIDLLESRAIKFMLPTALPDAEAVERFMREGRAASVLKSEHVARVYDVGRLENGAPYMVMEYLEGTDLGALIKRNGPLSPEEAIYYVLQAAVALAEAHARGIVHRDLKPANLFLTARPDGTACVKVLDFGISKMIGSGGDLDITKTHTVLGSPHYMAPEQMHSTRDVDGRSDIWSLGVILYVLVSGRLPFHGRSITELVAQVLERPPPPPSQHRPGLPPGLDAVILRCLQRDPATRFLNVGELAQALAPFGPPIAGILVDSIVRVVVSGTSTGLPLALSESQRLAAATPHGLPPQMAQLARAYPPAGPSSQPAWGSTAAGSPQRSSRLLLAFGLAGAMVLGAVIALGVANTRSGPAAATAQPVETAAVAPSAIPTVALAATPTPTATAQPSATAEPSATASASAAPRAVKAVPKADPFGMSRK